MAILFCIFAEKYQICSVCIYFLFFMASINGHGAHDAMADIEATKKCYFELIRRRIITDYQYIEPERETTIIT